MCFISKVERLKAKNEFFYKKSKKIEIDNLNKDKIRCEFGVISEEIRSISGLK